MFEKRKKIPLLPVVIGKRKQTASVSKGPS
jgi:hypothetical protein